MDNLYIIAGLGNPGSRFENTRHNVGFDTVDYISGQIGTKVTRLKHKALMGDGEMQGERILLVKPQTYMNLSGESIRDIVDWYKVTLDKVIIIYDDIDLQVGRIRVRPKGSAGTHNGMRSILYQLQSEDFPRVRIGIGKPPEGWQLADFVLSRFSSEERTLVNESVKSAAEAVNTIIKAGAEAAMNKFNK